MAVDRVLRLQGIGLDVRQPNLAAVCASTGNNSCAGTSRVNADPKAWIYVPDGYCDHIVGASKTPKA